MGFLGGLFKKKPGGTFVGNLFRKATNAVSGGLFGTGASKAAQDANDLANLSEDAYKKKYGMSKQDGSIRSGIPIQAQDATLATSGSVAAAKIGGLLTNGVTGAYDANQYNTGSVSPISDGVMSAQTMKLIRTIGMIVGGLLVAALAINFLFNKKR